jgi:hypothetical protein
MSTVHNLAIDVGKIGIWHFLVFSKVVVEHITANSEVTIVEVVVSGPTLRSELLSADNQRVEHAETKQKSLVL